MKKTIVISLIAILISSTLIVTPVQAATTASNLLSTQPIAGQVQGQNAFNQYQNDSSAKTGVDKQGTVAGKENVILAQHQDAKSGALASEQDSYIARILAWIVELIVGAIAYPLNWVAQQLTGQTDATFQIEKLVFNDYKIFDINFFTKEQPTGPLASFILALRDSVAGWYYGMRVLAIIASLSVLIYIAIRMALSTAASDKAKYKKMLQSWLVSLVILFLLHYLIMVMVYVSDALVNMLQNVKGNIGIEASLSQSLLGNQYQGWQALGRAIMLLTFTYLQLKFFIIYFKRTVVAAFLITVSPLITITYSIDKAGDNKAQAFQNWISEMTTIVFMQPMHALLFLIFAFSAGEIAKFSTFIALLMLWALSKGEKVLRGILKLGGSSSVGSLQDTKIIGKMIS